MLRRFVPAQDLDLHSASEDDQEPDITHEDGQSDEDEQQDPETPIVLKTMVGFVRNTDSNKNSPSPTTRGINPDDSATGRCHFLLCAHTRSPWMALESDSQAEGNFPKQISLSPKKQISKMKKLANS
jgi:hypothetical protein